MAKDIQLTKPYRAMVPSDTSRQKKKKRTQYFTQTRVTLSSTKSLSAKLGAPDTSEGDEYYLNKPARSRLLEEMWRDTRGKWNPSYKAPQKWA